jgi:hypothetical protein
MPEPQFANGHPLDKAELAEWMKYPSTQAMDAQHDAVHRRLCSALGLPSYSLRLASGEPLTETERDLARCEEAAVLHVQRWMQWLAAAGIAP